MAKKKSYTYILDENNKQQPVSPQEHSDWFRSAWPQHVVRWDEISNYEVSTVFLGEAWYSNYTCMYETAIFKDDDLVDVVRRYKTWKVALGGHEQVVESIRRKQMSTEARRSVTTGCD